MAGTEELSAPLHQISGDHEKVGPQPVLGVLANRLKCTGTIPVQITRRGFEQLWSDFNTYSRHSPERII